jgi:hypothetical protein
LIPEQPPGSPSDRKPECVCRHAWDSGLQARVGVGRRITFYNRLRSQAAHGGQPPAMGHCNAIEADQQVQAVAELSRNSAQRSGGGAFCRQQKGRPEGRPFCAVACRSIRN